MRKFKFFWQFDQEERWLNEMAAKGVHFKHKGFGYLFEKGEPEQANYRIDYRSFKNRREFADYIALFEDCGWAHVSGNKQSGAQYFKRIDGDSNEDIFSDVPSKAARYQRMSQMWLNLAICFIPIVVALSTTGAIDLSGFLHPKQLYFTPGLWEKTGAEFWRAFLFETPFALIRGFVWLTIPVMILVSLLFSHKANEQYRKTR